MPDCQRWRLLCTQLPDIELSLHTNLSDHKAEIFDNLLPKFTSPLIRRFSLNLSFYPDRNSFNHGNKNYSRLCSWLDWACHDKVGLQELNLKMERVWSFDRGVLPNTPVRVFQIPSLVILELRPWLCFHPYYNSRNNNNNNNNDALFHLPNLKKVSVELYPWNSAVLEQLVSSSPSLEDLFFEDPYVARQSASYGYHYLNLSSPSLRRLHMCLNYPIKVVLNTTNLEYLGVHGTSDKRQPFCVSFVNPPTAMLAASVGTQTFLPSNLFSLISNVVSLILPSRKTRPGPLLAETTFKQLTHLKFRVSAVRFAFAGAFTDLVFLQQCPGLEVLTFDFTYCLRTLKNRRWSKPDSAPQCLITTVKRIEIIECPFVPGFQTVLLRLLKYLLGSSKALELLQINIVGFRGDHYDDTYNELQFIKKVFEVPRSSPCCQIEFYGFDHYRVLRKSDHSTGSLLHQ